MTRRFAAVAILFSAVLFAAPARALDVASPEWGFGGTVVPMAFNPVTIEVMNNDREPFQGDVALFQGRSAIAGDIPLIERDLYIEPGGSRRLQFFPYISQQWNEFQLGWGPNFETKVNLLDETASLRFGPPTTVLLRDSGFLSRTNIGLPSFREDAFPISVSGTDGLKAVVLDHVPRWDNLRMQAFRDWIAAGGEVHLFFNDQGEHPKFPPPLEALNEPVETIALLGGRIHRHNLPITGIDKPFLNDVLGVASVAQERAEQDNRRGFDYDYQWSTGTTIAPLLRSLTRPDHNWALIYALSFAYLAVVFPGCWLLGRRRADFRITYPVLIGAVVLFSLAFKSVGQRGYGEETAWNSVAVVRPLGEGRWLTQGWSNAFVTSGGEYTFEHKGDGLLYATSGTDDVRHGEATNRPNAHCMVDIPPFSSQTIVHSGVFKGPTFNVRITSADLSANPPQFHLAVEGALPTPLQARALSGKNMLTVVQVGEELQTQGAIPLNQSLQGIGPYGYSMYDNETSPEAAYSSAEPTLLAESLRIGSDQQRDNFELPADQLRLFIYAPAPPEFLDVAGGPPKRNGWVLYAIDLAVPEESLPEDGL
jgi:hypothetical protein